MQATGSLAVPILIYSLELLTGTKRKYKCWIKNKKKCQPSMDSIIQEHTKYRGKGLMQTEGAYITQVIKLKGYAEHTQDPLMQIVRIHQSNTSSTLFQTATNLRNLFRVTTSK
jgi:hypothetical protein